MSYQPQLILGAMIMILSLVMIFGAKADTTTTVLDINTGQIKTCTKSGNTTTCF